MILLKDLREYWQEIAKAVPAIRKVEMLSVEKNMADKVTRILAEDTPALFFLAPSAESEGENVDTWRERTAVIAFVMQKYDARHADSASVLENVHPVVEALKRAMVDIARRPCAPIRVDVSTISTIPETEFFAGWAGWSIGFTV